MTFDSLFGSCFCRMQVCRESRGDAQPKPKGIDCSNMAVFTGGGGALSRRNGSSTRSRLLCLAPCIVCSIGVLLVLYQVAWMYWLPGALLHGKDTETIPIVQSNADGSLTVGTKTVTRRKPDQLYTLDHGTGQKVPKYVVFLLYNYLYYLLHNSAFTSDLAFCFLRIAHLQKPFWTVILRSLIYTYPKVWICYRPCMRMA